MTFRHKSCCTINICKWTTNTIQETTSGGGGGKRSLVDNKDETRETGWRDKEEDTGCDAEEDLSETTWAFEPRQDTSTSFVSIDPSGM